jgi:hypothetical protein
MCHAGRCGGIVPLMLNLDVDECELSDCLLWLIYCLNSLWFLLSWNLDMCWS